MYDSKFDYVGFARLIVIGIAAIILTSLALSFFIPSKNAEAEPYNEQKITNILLDMRDAQNAQARSLSDIAKELKRIK
jgi:hypothetical protein